MGDESECPEEPGGSLTVVPTIAVRAA
jgi:hypothetical protein